MGLRACALLLFGVAACSETTVIGVPPPEPVPPPAPATGPAPREPPQVGFTAVSGGCRNLFAYRASADGTQYAVVEIDREALGLGLDSSTTFDLGHEPAGIRASIDVYAHAPAGETYCTDFGTTPPAVAHWPAEAGRLTIELTRDPDPVSAERGTYRATLRLESAHFTSPEGGFAAVVPNIVIEDVRVGWLPG